MIEATSILIVEDSENDAFLMIHELKRQNFRIRWKRVETEIAMRSALENEVWDIVLSDYKMPSFSAPAALNLLKDVGVDLPFIVISGTVGEEVAVETMKAGAHDYIMKGNLARLGEAIRREIREARVRKEIVQMQLKLAQSDRMASIGLLAAGVAHEIKNPLSYVLSNLRLLKRDLSNFSNVSTADKLTGDERAKRIEKLRRQADSGLEGANRIHQIVLDVKNFSRVDEGRRVLVNLNEVLDGAARMAHCEIKYKAKLVKNYQDIPPVLASEGCLSQVFLNLLINAAHAIADGNPDKNEICVITRKEHGCVFAEVCDTGAGISQENQKKIFDPFFTTKPVGVGTGLGLAICQDIIKSYCGEIGLESTTGKGTRFWVRLPEPAADAMVV